MSGKGVCIVVPTYNERENIAPLVKAIEEARVEGVSVLFVDDSSPDGTGKEVLRAAVGKPWIMLLMRKGERGFTSAYQDGFREAFARVDPSVVVGMDADLQHPAGVVPELVKAVRGGAGVAIASRYVEGGRVVGWSLARRVVSRVANAYSRGLLGLPVKDATSGFKAFSRDAAEEVASTELKTKRFEYQIATLRLLKGKYRMVEVPYVFVARTKGKSKFALWDIPRFFLAVATMPFT